MAVRPTVQIGEPVIRAKAEPVINPVAPEVLAVVGDLVDSMRADNLVGMAAPQIGEGVRVFVSEIRTTVYREKLPNEEDSLKVFINPEILDRSQEIVLGYEGCGSVARAGLFARVPRPSEVTVKAWDGKGKEFTLHAEGLLARVIQNEVDHLDGKVFLDRLENMESVIGRDAYIALNKKS
jgi:peptide deformylase